MSILEDKESVRQHLRQRRSARPSAERDRAAAGLAEQVSALVGSLELGRPATVTGYLSMSSEPSLDAAIAALAREGHEVLIPRVVGRELAWIRWAADASERPGPLGIRELDGPAVEPTALEDIDLLLIPGLAADGRGLRLGQGGGYYDRFLAGVPRRRAGGPMRAIVLFDDEVLPTVPHEPHDQQVDMVVTPGRTLPLD